MTQVLTVPERSAPAAVVAATGGPSASPSRGAESGSRPTATVALAALTAASAAGLFRVFADDGWVGPVLATIAVVHLVCWLLRRARTASPVAVPVVGAAVLLMSAWTVLGRYTTYGLPTAAAWHHGISALSDLGNEIASMVAPVQATPSFKLVAVLGAAVTAAVADWAAFRWRNPMVALAPGLSAFIFCCTSGSGRGRGFVVGLAVAAICLFLLVEKATGGDGLIWFAGIRTGVGPRAAAAGGIIMAAAVVAAVAISPTLARRDGTGALGWRGGPGTNGGERIVPNPLVDLRTRLTQLTHRPVFMVDSTVPSYWRLTSLDTFDGVTWTSTGSYGGFGSRLPGAPPAGASVRTVKATFQIQGLDSVWLPAQFDPVSVRGVQHVSYDPQSNSLLTSKSTANGLAYSVTSYQYLDTVTAAGLEKAPVLARNGFINHNLELPNTLSPLVVALARHLTAGHATEYDKALAIQDYLRGPQFRYDLNPPGDGSGTKALETFLFNTQAGYCQQFAGAYAVLARAAGLPTRLAVGFDQGNPTGGGFQVHDGDYHTWPEVYFGPSFGWVPFEPTPGFSVPGTSGYSHTAGAPTGPAPSPATTVPATLPAGASSPPSTNPHPTGKASPTTLPPQAPIHRAGHVSPWWLTIPGTAILWTALTAGVPFVLRRSNDRRAARSGPRAVVLNIWQRLARQLEWQGVERRPDETDDEFARRASAALRRIGLDAPWTYGGLEAVASMARQARFAPSVPEGLGEQADVAGREVQRRLASLSSRRQRVLRLWLPPRGTSRRLVDLLGLGLGKGYSSSVPSRRRSRP